MFSNYTQSLLHTQNIGSRRQIRRGTINFLRLLPLASWLSFGNAAVTIRWLGPETLSCGSFPLFLAPANLLHKILFCTQFN